MLLYSNVNVIKIVRDDMGPLKTLDGIVITKTMTWLQLGVYLRTPECPTSSQVMQYEDNYPDTINVRTEEVQEKLHPWSGRFGYRCCKAQICFTHACMCSPYIRYASPMHACVLLTLEDKLVRSLTTSHTLIS